MKITIDKTKIEYRQPKSLISTAMAYLARWLRNIATIIPINPPYKYKGIKGWFKVLKAVEVGKSITVEPKSVEKEFTTHKDRLRLYDFLSSTSYFVLAFTVGIVLFILIAYLNSQAQSKALNLLIAGSFNLMSIIIGGFSAVLAAKIVGVLLDRRFADSLILPSSLYLVIDLNQHENLSNPDFKRNVLERIRTLRRNILLLSQTFTDTNLSENQEALWHLKNIETFIYEREGWVIAPKKNTLELLRKDFDKLAVILISGQYGEFKSAVKQKTKETVAPPLTFTDKLLRIIGVIFPYGILLVLYFNPEYIRNIGLDITTVFLIAIAWILLTIDARLKLGLVDRVTGLVKTVKELK